MPKKRTSRTKKKMNPDQVRNAKIFRLRGFHANAKTLPFDKIELDQILDCVDGALDRLGAETQTDYMAKKS